MQETANRIAELNLLIVYASFGEGHRQAALALKESFAALGAGRIVLIDLLAESHPLLNEVSRFFYAKSYSWWPRLYGWTYDATRGIGPNSPFSRWLHSFGLETLRKQIDRHHPDAVIHTFPLMALPLLAKRLGRHIPAYTVVTDFDLHLRWVHPGIDKYYVATNDLRDQLLQAGVPPARIAVTGIPLRRAFSPAPRLPAAESFGLDPSRPVVLVMAGGPPGFRELCRKLSEEASEAQIALVCGRNRALEAAMRREFAGTGSNVTVYGYVEHIGELMSAASCIVTKPGGLTLSEAMAAKLPIFLYRPLPGQERNNARYLEAKGAAVVCRTPAQLAASVASVLASPVRLRNMRRAAADLGKEDAAERIALDIAQNLPIIKVTETSIMGDGIRRKPFFNLKFNR